MIDAKIVSSLEKIFLDDKLERFEQTERLTALRGERVSVQLVHVFVPDAETVSAATKTAALTLGGSLAPYADARQVMQVAATKVTNEKKPLDDNYLRTTPGLYPDLLAPLYYNGRVVGDEGCPQATWIEIDLPETIEAGEYTLTCRLDSERFGAWEGTFTLDVIDAVLPKEDIYLTQWFHADCLANYYQVEPWSERHWEIVEDFARVARRGGINLLLTPVFTPPLDTAVGGERLTTQLVGVTRTNGVYAFDFSLLDRWIEMCDRVGIEYLEISHFFTQWGAQHAPKVMATVDGEYKKLFGWETEATGAEYTEFLQTFLSAFLDHMKARGDDRRCFFHISDEPKGEHLEYYRAAKAIVAELLEGYPIMDALSDFGFYGERVVSNPIPSTDHIAPFLEANVPHLWTYYCVGQAYLVSNRYLAMPAWRNRCIGMQLYKYRIEGFLQWGYNFYNNRHSGDAINPYCDASGGFWVPAGDMFSVYPAQDGTAMESTRFVVFYEALQDIKAMKLCEQYYGHDAVVAAIEEEFGQNITFETCTKSAEVTLRIRARINQMIRTAINGNI
ncbi:MAG: DUF4091 domain-containing protein [Clostridia bacterium]|nr:DUF4091 domain-containing protein [Clostridia bacterium]